MSALAGKTAVVTGATRGLGWRMVRGFAREGADVVVVSRKNDAVESRVAELRSEFSVTVRGRACNVGYWDQCDDLVKWLDGEVGAPDILVNNAGMSPVYPSVDQVEEALFDKVIATNLKGPFRLTANLGTRMGAASGGSIINISSIASVRPTSDTIPYAAAKAALNTMTVGMAQALGPTVRVNSIVAGPFLTDISSAWDQTAFDAIAQNFALGRAGRPDEIVSAAVFFAGEGSSYCTGSILHLDGGPR